MSLEPTFATVSIQLLRHPSMGPGFGSATSSCAAGRSFCVSGTEDSCCILMLSGALQNGPRDRAKMGKSVN